MSLSRTPLMGREEILRLIPHAGEMCLLDEIIFWDATGLRCCSRRLNLAGNPLRRSDGGLGMACGIEIAGQAMAAHGRLTTRLDAAPVPGMLVSLRDVALGHGPLKPAELLVEIEQMMADCRGASYQFSLMDAGEMLLSGRATVLFGEGL